MKRSTSHPAVWVLSAMLMAVGLYLAHQSLQAADRPAARDIVRLTGWEACSLDDLRGNLKARGHAYRLDVPEPLANFFQDGRRLLVARWPTEGKHRVTGGTTNTLIDVLHLRQPIDHWDGATLEIRLGDRREVHRAAVIGFDPGHGELTFDPPLPVPLVARRDSYSLHNVVTVLDSPGEYVIDRQAFPPRVILWPYDEANPNAVRIEMSDRRDVLTNRGPIWPAD